MATGSTQERRSAPRAARSLQLDASKHSAPRGGSAAFRPGSYRPPLGADAGTSRAPFRPPRRLDEPEPMPGFPDAAAPDAASGRLTVLPRGLGQAVTGAALGPVAADSMQPQSNLQAGAPESVEHQTQQIDEVVSGAVAPSEAGSGRGYGAVLPQRRPAAMRARRRPIAALTATPHDMRPNDRTTLAPETAQAQSSKMAATEIAQIMTASRDPAGIREPQPTAGESHAGIAVSSMDGTAAEHESRRRESREWMVRVACESAGIQRAILGSTSSSEQTPPSPHRDPVQQHALSPADPLVIRQPLEAPLPASADAAFPEQATEDEPTHVSSGDGAISPATKRRESREWLVQVAQQSAGLKAALALSSSSEEDARPNQAPDPTFSHAHASAAETGEHSEAASLHASQEAAAEADGLQPFGSIVEALCTAATEGGASAAPAMCEAAGNDDMEVAREDEGEGATREQSDGPLAAWHELKEAGCCSEAPLPSSTTDRSIDVVGLGSQELTSQDRVASAALSLAVPAAGRADSVGPAVLAEDAAPAEVKQSQSGDEDIEIDFGSQSLDRGVDGRQPRGSLGTVTKPSQPAPAQDVQQHRTDTAPPQGVDNRGQDFGSSPELQLCLDLSLSSKQTDVSASLQPQNLFASAAACHTPEQAPVAHSPPQEPAGSQDSGQERRSDWQDLQDMRTELSAMRPRVRPPSQQELDDSMLPLGVPAVVHQPAFYGRPEDVSHRPTGMFLTP
jgi:hypothetical protein